MTSPSLTPTEPAPHDADVAGTRGPQRDGGAARSPRDGPGSGDDDAERGTVGQGPGGASSVTPGSGRSGQGPQSGELAGVAGGPTSTADPSSTR